MGTPNEFDGQPRRESERLYASGRWRTDQRLSPKHALGPLGWFVWRTFRRFAGRGDYDKLVDLGGGEGYIAALFPAARRKIVLDGVPGALAVAKSRGLAAVQGDVRRLPFKDGACDLVLSSDVLEHLPPADLGVALREAARIMPPGGTALVNTSCYGLYLRRWLRRAPGPGRLDLDDLKDGHLSRPKRTELEAAIKTAGFRVKKRIYYKHLFQPITTLLVRHTRAGRDDEARAAKEKALDSGLLRAVNTVRIFVAGLDALFFGWLPGGAVIYKLEK